MTDVQQAAPAPVPADRTAAKPIRGPLRYDISTSSPQLTAGTPFSVFIKITNPYDVPAKILLVGARLPYEFCNLRTTAANRRWRFPWELGAPSRFGGMAALHDGSAESPAAGLPAAAGMAGPAAATMSPPQGFALAEAMPGAGRYPLPSGQTAITVLQPGNSVVHSFTFRTRTWLFFSPSMHDFHVQLAYEIDGEINQDSALCHLNIRTPLLSLVIGSALGSIGGFILKDVFHRQDLQAVITQPGAFPILTLSTMLLGNILLGVILVLGLARKKDAQPFLSVEDFWGGMFLGVVAGYGGKALAEQLLTHPLQPSAGAAAPAP